MEIGKKLKAARLKCGMTQEEVSEMIFVSRQSISNWENEKTFPDISSVIKLSDLYSISLDELLKGDEKMRNHLEESTNLVKSNKQLLSAIFANILIIVLLICMVTFIPEREYIMLGVFLLMTVSSSALLYQIIKRF